MKNNDNGDFYVENKLDVFGAFLNDTWAMGRLTLNAGVRWDRYRNWLPEQRQVAFSHGTPELTIPDATFAETEVNTWNSFAPRLGMVFDLTGDGRSVIRANYGLYWHNPGVGLSSNANQNQVQKTITRTWNDANGDRRWQPGEEGQVTSTNLAGSRTIDPDLKQPYTHEFGVFYERQLAEVIGSRVGFVYKTEDDLFESVSGQPPAERLHGAVPVRRSRRGRCDRHRRRSHHHALRHACRARVAAQRERAGDEHRPPRTGWDFKATASYDAPFGIRVSPVVRHQAGDNFAREIPIAACAHALRPHHPGHDAVCACARGQPAGQHHGDRHPRGEDGHPRRTDQAARLLRPVQYREQQRGRNVTRTTGTSYLRPTAILAPRTGRLGFRFLW